jgi:hypothetical protein
VREESLEAVRVLFHGPRAPALGELKQRRRAEGRPKPQVEEVLEVASAWCSFVLLQLDVPQLGHVLEVVGGHPDLLLRHGSLLMEIGLTTVDEDQRIRLAIVAREIHLLKPGWAILVVLAGRLAVSCGRRLIGGQGLDCLGVGLGGGLEGLYGLGEVLDGGLWSSPMAGTAQEVAEPGDEGPAAGDDEVGRVGEDRRDRDTRLSRTSNP